jgi:hypothetical protein
MRDRPIAFTFSSGSSAVAKLRRRCLKRGEEERRAIRPALPERQGGVERRVSRQIRRLREVRWIMDPAAAT